MPYSSGLSQLRRLYQTYGNKWVEQQARSQESDGAKQLQTALYLYEHNDKEAAFRWMRSSAESNNPEAQFNLALFYLQGMGCTPNSTSAQTWLDAARKLGHVEARRAQQIYSVYGISALRPWALRKPSGMKIDTPELERTISNEGPEYCDAKFYYGLGVMLKSLAAGIKVQPCAHLSKAAELGHADSMFVVAWWHHHVLEDVQTALEFYKKAIALNDLSYARYNLGLAYYDMCKWNYYTGEMSSCASFHDYAPAKLHLGIELIHGRSIDQNVQAGMLLVHSAADQELPDAAMALARMHHKGLFIKKSLRNAIYWYEKAARLGKNEALYNLSVLHGPSTEKGFKLLAQAAKSGVVLAQNDYGTMLAKTGDFCAAEHWLRLAATRGDKTAEKNIALLRQKLDESLPLAPVAGMPVTA